MNKIVLDKLMTKIVETSLEGRTDREKGLILKGRLPAFIEVSYKGDQYRLTSLFYDYYKDQPTLEVSLNKEGLKTSLAINQGNIGTQFSNIRTLDELFDSLYDLWEVDMAKRSSENNEIDTFLNGITL